MSLIIKGKTAIYEQIVDHYKKYIDLNIYLPNDKLPSCRELAKQLGINPNTVERAYQILESDGYIHTIAKKGVYILERKNSFHNIIREQIQTLKNNNVDLETLLSVVNEVYGEEIK